MFLFIFIYFWILEFLQGQILNRTSIHGNASGHAEWTYWELGHGLGPDHWPKMFATCAGHHQSPIDIQTHETVYDPGLKEFAIFFDPPLPGSKFMLHNNGHSIEVTTQGEFYVANGGLQSLYKSEQFHFHWGSVDYQGSEHKIDGRSTCMEMHICSWNVNKYKSFKEAAQYPGGVAALAIQFEVSPYDNPVLEDIVQVLKYIKDPDSKIKVSIQAFSLKDLLPPHPEKFYRYEGSVTTPACYESIIWSVFEGKQTISERQLQVFRNMLSSQKDGRKVSRSIWDRPMRNKMVDNFRPPQPLNGRTVYRSFHFQNEPTQAIPHNVLKYYLDFI